MLGDGSHGMRMRGIGFQLISRSISVGASALSSMSPSLNKAPVAPVRSSDHWLHEVVAVTRRLDRAGMTERKDRGALLVVPPPMRRDRWHRQRHPERRALTKTPSLFHNRLFSVMSLVTIGLPGIAHVTDHVTGSVSLAPGVPVTATGELQAALLPLGDDTDAIHAPAAGAAQDMAAIVLDRVGSDRAGSPRYSPQAR